MCTHTSDLLCKTTTHQFNHQSLTAFTLLLLTIIIIITISYLMDDKTDTCLSIHRDW